MYTKKELIQLKQNYYDTLSEINELGKEQFKDILELIEWLEDLMEKTERLKKQEEAPNQDLRQKMKLGRKMQKAYKYDTSFEATIIHAINEGKLSNEIGERFKEMATLLKKRKISEMKHKFKYFENLIKLNKKYQKYTTEIEEIKSDLETKINKIENILTDLKWLNKLDTKKFELIENHLKDLNKLKDIRLQYISSLLDLKLSDLLIKIKEENLFDYDFPHISQDKLDELEELFKNDKFFSNMKIYDLVKYFDYSDQKLSHVYPEISKFKKLILRERVWFDKISHLDQTKFLMWKKEEPLNNKLKEFYEKLPNSKDILKSLEVYEKELPGFKEKYKEYEEYKIKLEELSEYSKDKLEKELQTYKELLDTLNSEVKEVKKSEGFFDKLKGFLST